MKKYFLLLLLPLTLAACKGKDAVVIENDTPNFSVSSETPAETPGDRTSGDRTSDDMASASITPAASGESMFIVVSDTTVSEEPQESVGSESGSAADDGRVGDSQSDSDRPDHVVVNGKNIVLMAQSLIGKPFTDGGDDPEVGFDNSGFIYYVLRSNGYINCPRQSSEQTEIGQKITAASKLAPGDLVFFGSGGKADFGGVYIGDGQMIYSPMPGQTVKQIDMASAYWRDAFVFGVDLRN